MSNTINYCENQLNREDLTSIRGELILNTIHKIRNEVKSNVHYVWPNLRGVTQVHIDLFLTDSQCSVIYNTPFVHPNHLVSITTPANTTASITNVIHDTHTKDLQVLREVMGGNQAFIQQIFAALDKS